MCSIIPCAVAGMIYSLYNEDSSKAALCRTIDILGDYLYGDNDTVAGIGNMTTNL